MKIPIAANPAQSPRINGATFSVQITSVTTPGSAKISEIAGINADGLPIAGKTVGTFAVTATGMQTVDVSEAATDMQNGVAPPLGILVDAVGNTNFTVAALGNTQGNAPPSLQVSYQPMLSGDWSANSTYFVLDKVKFQEHFFLAVAASTGAVPADSATGPWIDLGLAAVAATSPLKSDGVTVSLDLPALVTELQPSFGSSTPTSITGDSFINVTKVSPNNFQLTLNQPTTDALYAGLNRSNTFTGLNNFTSLLTAAGGVAAPNITAAQGTFGGTTFEQPGCAAQPCPLSYGFKLAVTGGSSNATLSGSGPLQVVGLKLPTVSSTVPSASAPLSFIATNHTPTGLSTSTWNVAAAPDADGTSSVTVSVTDVAGNSTSTSVPFVIDKTGPVLPTTCVATPGTPCPSNTLTFESSKNDGTVASTDQIILFSLPQNNGTQSVAPQFQLSLKPSGSASVVPFFTVDANGFDLRQGIYRLNGNPIGTGGVTSFSAGNATPLFTTSVASPTTTPTLSFALSAAPAHTVLGNNSGSAATPAYVQLGFTDLLGNVTCAQTAGLTGDVTSSSASCGTIVTGLQGRAVSGVTPLDGQALAWNRIAGLWEPANVVPTIVAGLGIGTSTGSNNSITINNTGILGLVSGFGTSITNGQNPTVSVLSAPVGGDLGGTSSVTATVIGLQNRPVLSAAPTNGQTLTWTGTAWGPANVTIPAFTKAEKVAFTFANGIPQTVTATAPASPCGYVVDVTANIASFPTGGNATLTLQANGNPATAGDSQVFTANGNTGAYMEDFLPPSTSPTTFTATISTTDSNGFASNVMRIVIKSCKTQ